MLPFFNAHFHNIHRIRFGTHRIHHPKQQQQQQYAFTKWENECEETEEFWLYVRMLEIVTKCVYALSSLDSRKLYSRKKYQQQRQSQQYI